MVWPMLAISRVLRKSSQTIALGQQYENFVRLIAGNFLLIFYRGNGEFNRMPTVNNASLPPSASNYDEGIQYAPVTPFER